MIHEPRPFSEQHANKYQMPNAASPDRLVPNWMINGSKAADFFVQSRETWFCDALMDPFSHPMIANFLFSSADVAREHSDRIASVEIWFAARGWSVAAKAALS